MRKLLISILLASAMASPAFAQDRDNENRPHWGDRQESRPERGQAREERQQAREQARQERPQVEQRQQFEQRQQVEQRQQFEQRQQDFARQQQYVRQQQVQSNDGNRFEGRQRADGVSRWNRDNVQQVWVVGRYYSGQGYWYNNRWWQHRYRRNNVWRYR